MSETKQTLTPKKPYLSILFECCGVYTRVYRQPKDTQYTARCPKCLRSSNIKVDPTKGVSSRFLKAF